MKILIITSVPVTPPWDQGDKNLAYTLASALPEDNFKILTKKRGDTTKGKNLDGIPVFETNNPSLYQKARVLLNFQKYCVGISAIHFIYRPYWLSSWLLRLSPYIHHYPKLHTVPSTADGRSLNTGLFFSDRIVTISRYGKQKLEAHGIKHVYHIPPGINAAEWGKISNDGKRYKHRLGLSGHPVILFPGHYGKGQGADLMCHAIPGILAQDPDARFIFACRNRSLKDEHHERELRNQLKDDGLDYAVRFFHRVINMKNLIGACDIVALPLETMRDKLDIPTTLLESLAARRPIVITDIPPMNELIKNDQSGDHCIGLATPPGDVHALAEGITRLIQDARLRENMGVRGQELVHSQYDSHVNAGMYKKLYRELVT